MYIYVKHSYCPVKRFSAHKITFCLAEASPRGTSKLLLNLMAVPRDCAPSIIEVAYFKGSNFSWCRVEESNFRRQDFPFLDLDYLIIPTKSSGAGRLCGIIVGAHPLVSTPAFAKATAGRPAFCKDCLQSVTSRRRIGSGLS
jgi:hypothetical protein